MPGKMAQQRIQQTLQLAQGRRVQVAQPRVSDLHFYNSAAWDSVSIPLKFMWCQGQRTLEMIPVTRGPKIVRSMRKYQKKNEDYLISCLDIFSFLLSNLKLNIYSTNERWFFLMTLEIENQFHKFWFIFSNKGYLLPSLFISYLNCRRYTLS